MMSVCLSVKQNFAWKFEANSISDWRSDIGLNAVVSVTVSK